MKSSHVYVISAPNGLVKVGMGASAYERFYAIQSNSPLPLTLAYVCEFPESAKIEAVVHRAFRPYHRHGEWFALAVDIAVAGVREAIAGYGGLMATAIDREAAKQNRTGRKARLRATLSECAALQR